MWKAVFGATVAALTSTTSAWATSEACVGDCADEVGLLQRKTTKAKVGRHGAALESAEEGDAVAQADGDMDKIEDNEDEVSGEKADAVAKKDGDKEESGSSTDSEDDDDTSPSLFSDSADDEAAEVYAQESLGHFPPGQQHKQDRKQPPGVLVVPAFTKNPGYGGPLHSTGHVKVLGWGVGQYATQVLHWDLTGVDPKCTQELLDESEEGPTDACLITINEGLSCFGEETGGAYPVERSPSPGKNSRYIAGPLDESKGTASIRTGLDNARIDGHVMLIHDHEGVAVACGIVQAKSLGVKAFTPYFDYTGNLDISGRIGVDGQGVVEGASQAMLWSLHGTDPRCSNGADINTKNSCGAHIHEGANCAEDAGGHFWNKDAIEADPWAPVGYKSLRFFSSETVAWNKGWVVDTGVNMWNVNGKTLIVHDYEGKRAACGIVQACRGIANAFIPYLESTGAFGRPVGHIVVEGSGILSTAAQTLSWNLDHVDPRCDGIASAYTSPNSCGIHIHEATSCDHEAGPHFYDEHLVDKDPWTAVHYVAHRMAGQEEVEFATKGHAKVTTGYNMADAVGHAMIVHNWEGTKVACGIVVIAEYSERPGAGLTV